MNVVVISYPAGGFGNFLFYVLSEFADRTVKINDPKFEFNANGDSHRVKKYTNIWFNDPDRYNVGFTTESDEIVLVLCDNGINNDSYDKIRQYFNNPTILRVTIDYDVRPVIYHTCVVKAMKSNVILENSKEVNKHWIDCDKPYAQRENFTLLYHHWPFKWDPDETTVNISLEDLINNPVQTLSNIIHAIGCSVIRPDDLKKCCDQWITVNQQYFDIYFQWQNIKHALESGTNYSLDHITDLHAQGYINYRIEKMFNCTIPVYDYQNWFKNTREIKKCILQHSTT